MTYKENLSYYSKYQLAKEAQKRRASARQLGLAMIVTIIMLLITYGCTTPRDYQGVSGLSSNEVKFKYSLRRPEMIVGQVGRVIFDDNDFIFPVETYYIKSQQGKILSQTRYFTIHTYNPIKEHNVIVSGDGNCNPQLLSRDFVEGRAFKEVFSVQCNLNKVIVFDAEKTYYYRFLPLKFQSMKLKELTPSFQSRVD